MVGALGGERRRGGNRADHVAAGSGELGLREAVERVPQADHGAATSSDATERVHDVGCADGDHERVVGRARTARRCAGRRSRSCPAAVTTVTPFNQSFSTAWSSGSKKTLAGLDACSEKFATLMLYWFLFARIQSQAAMTSATVDWPGVAHHVDRHEVRARRDARVTGGRARRDAGDERAVPVACRRGRSGGSSRGSPDRSRGR